MIHVCFIFSYLLEKLCEEDADVSVLMKGGNQKLKK